MMVPGKYLHGFSYTVTEILLIVFRVFNAKKKTTTQGNEAAERFSPSTVHDAQAWISLLGES